MLIFQFLHFLLMILDIFVCLIKFTILPKKKPVLKTIFIKFNVTFYVKDYCKVSGHNMLYFRKYSHFLSEIMILYLYKKNKYNQKSSVFEYN